MAKENHYVCEECNFKADKLKMCCGKKMIETKYTTKCTYDICGCKQ